MNITFLEVILVIYIFAYIFAGSVFMLKQKQGASFIISCDKALIRGGCFFVFSSGLSLVVKLYGGLLQVFI